MKKTFALFLMALLIFAVTSAAFCQEEFKGFSGASSEYKDTDVNVFKINIPSEFNLTDKGETTYWTGPIIDDSATTIAVNCVIMKGVPSATIYQINLKSKKEDCNYVEVTPIKVNLAGKPALAFTCKESNLKPGTTDEKPLDEIHRWHLFVFGNDRVYTCGFSGSYKSFKDGKLQDMFNKVIKSFELIPAKKS